MLLSKADREKIYSFMTVTDGAVSQEAERLVKELLNITKQYLLSKAGDAHGMERARNVQVALAQAQSALDTENLTYEGMNKLEPLRIIMREIAHGLRGYNPHGVYSSSTVLAGLLQDGVIKFFELGKTISDYMDEAVRSMSTISVPGCNTIPSENTAKEIICREVTDMMRAVVLSEENVNLNLGIVKTALTQVAQEYRKNHQSFFSGLFHGDKGLRRVVEFEQLLQEENFDPNAFIKVVLDADQGSTLRAMMIKTLYDQLGFEKLEKNPSPERREQLLSAYFLAVSERPVVAQQSQPVAAM